MKRAFGDSLTAGSTVPTSRRFTNLLQSRLGITIENDAVPGSTACSHSAVIYGKNVAVGDVSTYLIGTNDHILYKGDAAKIASFKSMLEAQIAWLCIPNKTMGLSPSITKTGSWVPTAAYFIGINAADSGSTASFNFSGDTCFIGVIQRDLAAAPVGTFSVKVDGVLYGNYSTQSVPAPGAIISNGIYYAPSLIIITGIGSGAHTVVITKTNSDGNVFLDWFATPSTDAKVIQIGIAQLSAGGYSAQASAAENVIEFNKAIADTVTKMSAWLNVGFVPVVDTIRAIDIGVDGIHWNSIGHSKVADLLEPLI